MPRVSQVLPAGRSKEPRLEPREKESRSSCCRSGARSRQRLSGDGRIAEDMKYSKPKKVSYESNFRLVGGTVERRRPWSALLRILRGPKMRKEDACGGTLINHRYGSELSFNVVFTHQVCSHCSPLSLCHQGNSSQEGRLV